MATYIFSTQLNDDQDSKKPLLYYFTVPSLLDMK